MLISHKYKFIFFENPKASSRSMVKLLRDIDKDIVYYKEPDGRKGHQLGHVSPFRSGILNEPFFSEYVSFVVLRNPADRLISSMNYHVGLSKTPIEHFRKVEKRGIEWCTWCQPQMDFVAEGTRVLRLETLNHDIEALFAELGILYQEPEKRNKTKTRLNNRTWATLEPEQKTFLLEKYARDFANIPVISPKPMVP